MTLVASMLLILSAITHAGWNFISKKTRPTIAFFLVTNIVGVICVIPVFIIFYLETNQILQMIWIQVLLSGFFLSVYMAALAIAYSAGDLSIVYPLTRSIPIIIVTLAAIIFDIGQSLTWLFILGAGFIFIGCFILPMKNFSDFKIRNYLNTYCLMAFLGAVCISGYTIVDYEALSLIKNLKGKPFSPLQGTLVYWALQGVICTIWMMIFVISRESNRRHLMDVLKRHKASATITGVGIYLTYGLVLLSMNFVTNVSYIAAFRQISIPIGTIMGIILLKEPRFRPKILGVTYIFIGVIVVGFF